jgi:hypothetical protein
LRLRNGFRSQILRRRISNQGRWNRRNLHGSLSSKVSYILNHNYYSNVINKPLTIMCNHFRTDIVKALTNSIDFQVFRDKDRQ